MNGSVLKAVRGELTFPNEKHLGLYANKFAADVKEPIVIWLEGELIRGAV